jgi:NodT family efflux transporter outer membrane factor (OMF) lipoprotein
LAFAALSVVGCSTLPDVDPSATIAAPNEFAAIDGVESAPVSDWLGSFNDPQVLALVEQAMQSNPSVSAARANLDAAFAAARISGASRLPSLDASLSGTENDPGVTSYGAGLSASWQADIWGRLSDNANAGRYSAESARADWYGTRLSIAAATAQAWYGLAAAALQSDLSRQDVSTREGQLNVVERRFARGVAPSSDVRSARSALASSRSNLAAALRNQAASARALEVLIAEYPTGRTIAASDLPELGELPNPGSPEALLERRPDIVAARANLVAAGFSAQAAQKALYPGLSLTASISDAASDLGDIDFDDLVSSITASVTAPLFNRGSLRASRDQAQANAEALAASYASTVLSAFNETENAIDADVRLAEQVNQLTVASSEAQAALELVERQYASGVATIFDLINAQSSAISAQSALISARANRVDNRIALHLAIAGNFLADGGIAPNIEN